MVHTIQGVETIKRDVIRDLRGSVKHGLRTDEEWFISADNKIGEIYFSEVNPGIIKGWHLHTKMTLRYLCVSGRATIFLYDERFGGTTFGTPMKIELAADGPHYVLLTIPPYIWNAFRAKEGSVNSAIICNIASIPHDPDEIIRTPLEALLNFPLSLGEYNKEISE